MFTVVAALVLSLSPPKLPIPFPYCEVELTPAQHKQAQTILQKIDAARGRASSNKDREKLDKQLEAQLNGILTKEQRKLADQYRKDGVEIGNSGFYRYGIWNNSIYGAGPWKFETEIVNRTGKDYKYVTLRVEVWNEDKRLKDFNVMIREIKDGQKVQIDEEYYLSFFPGPLPVKLSIEENQ